ncbi:MAG: hypothetical protein RO257_02780 [Candidatus Kapabacteria bacterium]|nr:hypothetical protein [Candidatus Kapabacteria bacterium]
MLRFNLIISFMLLALGFAIYPAEAQNFPPKAKERMETVKKMRLLEILELSDAEADKFLVKYTAVEKEIREKNTAFQDANDNLIEYIDKNPDGKEIAEKTNAVIQAQKELHAAVESKFSTLKYVLSEQNFAKMVAFEIKFEKRVRRMLLNRDQMDGAPAYETMPPQMQQRRKGR